MILHLPAKLLKTCCIIIVVIIIIITFFFYLRGVYVILDKLSLNEEKNEGIKDIFHWIIILICFNYYYF